MTIALVGGGSNIVYSVAEMHPYPRSAYDLNYNDLTDADKSTRERQQMADEDEQASAHLMVGYTSMTCGEF